MPKLKHLKDTQWTRNIVYNHQDKLWDKSHHQQNNSRLINREFIVISYRREQYQTPMKECSHDEDAYYNQKYSHLKMIRINFEEKPIHERIIY